MCGGSVGGGGWSCEESGTLFTGPNNVKKYYHVINYNYVYLGL